MDNLVNSFNSMSFNDTQLHLEIARLREENQKLIEDISMMREIIKQYEYEIFTQTQIIENLEYQLGK